jgi:hypothetical protein
MSIVPSPDRLYLFSRARIMRARASLPGIIEGSEGFESGVVVGPAELDPVVGRQEALAAMFQRFQLRARREHKGQLRKLLRVEFRSDLRPISLPARA